MPGYGKPMEKYAPAPAETKEVKDRFTMPAIPQLTIVQMIIAGVIVAYAFLARKVKGVVVATLALTIGLLHMYDHLYRVKRVLRSSSSSPVMRRRRTTAPLVPVVAVSKLYL